MKRTSAKVGEQVRVYTNIPRKYGVGRTKGVFYDGIIHEIVYNKSNLKKDKLFKDGYVMLSGKYLLHIGERWIRSTKKKIGLDVIVRIARKVK